MNNYDIKCRIIEEELRSVWQEWHVAGHLGEGAFGDVFQIYRDNFGIRVDSSLKVIQVSGGMAGSVSQGMLSFNRKDDRGAGEENRTAIPDALRDEIQIMETLRGAPNIVIIEDFYFKKNGPVSTLFVRMELLTSLQEELSDRQGRRKLSSIREILKFGRDICTALIYCEKRGIIHGDIKPANLFVDRFGDYKVGDFGTSKHINSERTAQTLGGIGTVSYMAPELFRGFPCNNTVDIYALGLVLYQLLNNGRIPFLPASEYYTGQDIDRANYLRLHGNPLPGLAGKAVGSERIDDRLDAVVRKACAINPADRFQTAKEFYDALAFREMPVQEGRAEYGIKSPEKPPVKAPAKSPGTPPPDSFSQKQPGRESVSKGNRILIGIIVLLILAVSAAAVRLVSRRVTRSSPGFDLEANDTEYGKDGTVPETNSDTDAINAGNEKDESVSETNSDTDSIDKESDDDGSQNDGSAPETNSGIGAADPASREENSVSGTISDSWEEIAAAGEDGTYVDKYSIGDTKELDLGEEGKILMELVALDADELADGSGNAHMTWIAKDLLNSDHAMNESQTNRGGWPASDMRAWLRDSILPLFPDTVRSNIKEVKKYYYSYDDEGTVSSTDTIWLPSAKEIIGGTRVFDDIGTEYLIAYPEDTSRQKYHIGSSEPSWWWLRTASAYSGTSFNYIYSGGSGWSNYSADYAGGVAVGFCL